MLTLTAVLLGLALPIAAAPADTTDYLFGRDDLSDISKDLHDGEGVTDPNLAKWLSPGQKVTAIMMRATKENGKITKIEVWYSTRKHPKAEQVREKPFTPTDKDFKALMKAISQEE